MKFSLFILIAVLISYILTTSSCGPGCLRCHESPKKAGEYSCERCASWITKVNDYQDACDSDLESQDDSRNFYFSSRQPSGGVGIFGCKNHHQAFIAQTDKEVCYPLAKEDKPVKDCIYYFDDTTTCRQCLGTKVPAFNITSNTTTCVQIEEKDFNFDGCTSMLLNATNRVEGFCFQCQPGKVLDWTTNICNDQGSLGIEGCIIEDSLEKLCKECDVGSGYYMDYDVDTKKMICLKDPEVKGGC